MASNASHIVDVDIGLNGRDVERSTNRRWMKIEPATVFCIVICGVMIFVISMTVRTQSRNSPSAESSQLPSIEQSSERDQSAALELIAKQPTALPISMSNSPSDESSQLPSTSSASPSSSPRTAIPSYQPTALIMPSQFPSAQPADAHNITNPFNASLLNTTISSINNEMNSSTTNHTELAAPTAAPLFEPKTLSPTAYTPVPTLQQPTASPSQQTTTVTDACFTTAVYDSIDAEVERLKLTITDSIERSHFLGGIVR